MEVVGAEEDIRGHARAGSRLSAPPWETLSDPNTLASLEERVVGVQREEGLEEVLLVSLGPPYLVRSQAGGRLAAPGAAG